MQACYLCEGPGPLQMSHIIPRFVYEWLLSSNAGRGYMRPVNLPNVRRQDGPKQRLLCDSCETIFSRWESQFASKIFIPFHRDWRHRCRYGPWLPKFAVSISWRALTVRRQASSFSHFPISHRPFVDEALNTWRDYLFDRRPSFAPFEQRLIHLDRFPPVDRKMPPNMNRWLFLTTDADWVTDGNNMEAYVIVKLCRIFVIGTIHTSDRRLWKGGKIHPQNGAFGEREFHVPPFFWDYCALKAQAFGEAMDQMSDLQKRKIMDDPRNIPVRESEFDRAMRLDVQQFGDGAYGIGTKALLLDMDAKDL